MKAVTRQAIQRHVSNIAEVRAIKQQMSACQVGFAQLLTGFLCCACLTHARLREQLQSQCADSLVIHVLSQQARCTRDTVRTVLNPAELASLGQV